MNSGQVLDVIGSLISTLKGFSAKLPPVVHLKAVPGGIKPKEEAVEAYEQAIYRFRDQSASTPFRKFSVQFLESLEAFEQGNVLASVQPLLSVLDHLERMHRDKEIVVAAVDEKRMAEYRTSLNKVLPGNQPELEGAGKGMV